MLIRDYESSVNVVQNSSLTAFGLHSERTGSGFEIFTIDFIEVATGGYMSKTLWLRNAHGSQGTYYMTWTVSNLNKDLAMTGFWGSTDESWNQNVKRQWLTTDPVALTWRLTCTNNCTLGLAQFTLTLTALEP